MTDSVTRLAREIATLFCLVVEKSPETMKALESLLRKAMDDIRADEAVGCSEHVKEAYTRAAEVARTEGEKAMQRADRCCGNKIAELAEVTKAIQCKEIAAAIERLKNV